MSTEQSSTPKEGKRTTSIGNSRRTMAGDQHRYHRTPTKIKWNGRNSGHCRPIYKDDQTKGNSNECIIGRDHQNLHRRNLETTWNTQENPK